MYQETEPAARATGETRPGVDNTDWLKTVSIILVAVDHFGYFFVENDQWWSVFGRLAAPTFFFLLGYAASRHVPVYWIVLGAVLTLLDSSNNDWTWVAPNILLSFALIRFARPAVLYVIDRHAWASVVGLSLALVAAAPFSTQMVEYGTAGWLWALLGVCRRSAVDGMSIDAAGSSATSGGIIPLVAVTTAGVYLWQEQKAYAFTDVQFTVFAMGTCALTIVLVIYRRGKSPVQPPASVATVLRFVGRRTLEIYALQLAGSELLIKLMPDLAP
jgi:hypothetical protein